MRLFVAIELDEVARRTIGVEQRRLEDLLSRGRRAIRWIRPEHLHLTLAFLGEVADDCCRSVIEAMERPIPLPRFRITFGGVGVFPPQGGPRILWLGLSRGAPEVVAIQRLVVQRVTNLGIAAEDRPFHPHLTLARWRRSRPGDGRLLAAERGRDVTSLDVGAVALVESRLSPAGPAYHVLCRARLADDTGGSLQSDVGLRPTPRLGR